MHVGCWQQASVIHRFLAGSLDPSHRDVGHNIRPQEYPPDMVADSKRENRGSCIIFYDLISELHTMISL